MSYPPPPPPLPPPMPGTPVQRPVSGWRVFAAGLLDQVALFGHILFWIFLADDLPGSVGVVVFVAIFGALVLVGAQSWALVRLGSTAGLFVLGVRAHPADPFDWENALDWFVSFWQSLVVVPVAWLLDKVLHRLLGPAGDDHEDYVRDPRCRGFGARCARVLVVLVIAGLWAPLVLAVAG